MADAKTPLLGLTIPAADGSDSPGEWPRIAGQGLIDLENSLILGLDKKVASDAYSTYPIGISTTSLTLAGAQNGGWPGVQGVVLSMRRTDGTITYQLKIDSDGSVRTRFGSVSAGWSSWTVTGSPNLPTAMASGQVTGSPPDGGGTVAMNVVFPKGVFTTAPRITLAAQSSLPSQLSYSYGNVSATSCTIYLYRQNATDTSISWVAVQGVDG